MAKLQSTTQIEPADRPVHDWLLDKDSYEHGPIDAQIRLRNYIADLPETKATFSKCEALEGTDLSYQCIRDEMLSHVGSWLAPVDGVNDRWVNPNYPHLEQFTDIIATCECGARFSLKNCEDVEMLNQRSAHTDDCCPRCRTEAQLQLYEKRHEALRQTLLYGQTLAHAAGRFCLDPSTMPNLRYQLGVDIKGLQDEYTERRRHTAIRLLLTHPLETVATAYEIQPATVRRIINDRTPYTLAELRATRENP